jgi:hypothetical protein
MQKHLSSSPVVLKNGWPRNTLRVARPWCRYGLCVLQPGCRTGPAMLPGALHRRAPRPTCIRRENPQPVLLCNQGFPCGDRCFRKKCFRSFLNERRGPLPMLHPLRPVDSQCPDEPLLAASYACRMVPLRWVRSLLSIPVMGMRGTRRLLATVAATTSPPSNGSPVWMPYDRPRGEVSAAREELLRYPSTDRASLGRIWRDPVSSSSASRTR